MSVNPKENMNPNQGISDQIEDDNNNIEKRSDDDQTKRPSEDATENSTPNSTKRVRTEVLDLAETLGYKPGDRFEVLWEITEETDDDDNDDVAAAAARTPSCTTRTRWWGAKLLPHDGRTEDSVAIRMLDYDPYPEGGFPERSTEDVIFLGKDLLVDPHTHVELEYRPEGELASPVWLGRSQVEDVVNETLEKALKKNEEAWKCLSGAQKASIAETIASKKEKLLQLLLNHPRGVVTSTDMQNILAQTMQEHE